MLNGVRIVDLKETSDRYLLERDAAYEVIDQMKTENYADASHAFKFSKRAKRYRKQIRRLKQENEGLRWTNKDLVHWKIEQRTLELLRQQAQALAGNEPGAQVGNDQLAPVAAQPAGDAHN